MFGAVDVGIASGIFAKHGVEVEKIAFEGGAKLEQGMAAGSVDIAASGSTDLLFTAKGVPEKAVAVFGGPPYSLAILVRMDGSVQTAADLKGKKIGVSTPGSLTFWLAQQFAVHQGWSADAVTPVPVGGMSAEISALVTKQVDGIVAPIETGVQFEEEKRGKNFVNFGDLLPHFVTYIMFATDSAMKTQGPAVRSFIAGWFETVAYMKKNKEPTVAVLAKVMNTSPAITSKIYDIEIAGYTDDGHFDSEVMKDLYNTLIVPNLGDQRVDISSLYTDAFLPK
jgi:ABC-type nitrate/sulfonate/bicarbonate transport system substrate-binding protein